MTAKLTPGRIDHLRSVAAAGMQMPGLPERRQVLVHPDELAALIDGQVELRARATRLANRTEPPGDWACVECRPYSDILVDGFRCDVHALRGEELPTEPTQLEAVMRERDDARRGCEYLNAQHKLATARAEQAEREVRRLRVELGTHYPIAAAARDLLEQDPGADEVILADLRRTVGMVERSTDDGRIAMLPTRLREGDR